MSVPTAPAVAQPTYRLEQVRRVTTALPGPRSTEWLERRKAAVTSGVSSALPIYAADADGGVIVDVDGNSLIDMATGIGVTAVGANNPVVAAAITEQVQHFTHTCFSVTQYPGYVQLAEELAKLTPGDFDKRSAFFNSGAEAVENAIKVARLATGRDAVIVFDHAYHGRTNLTMAMTAKVLPYKQGFGPFAPEVYRAPVSYPYRDGLTGPEAAARAISQLDKQVGAGNIAAIIIEPVLGEGGFIEPAPGFLAAIAEWAKAAGAVFIADEVQSGFCRTGSWFAIERDDVEPDIVVTAKGLGGGMPISAITGRAELLDAVHPGGLGGTYGGNPVACASALATISQMRDLDLPSRARAIEVQAKSVLNELATTVPAIGEVRGRGGMLAIEFVKPGTLEPDADLTRRIIAAALAQGLILLSCGTYGNVIRLLPPLVISDELFADALSVLSDAITVEASH